MQPSPVYAGGARRGAAPVVRQVAPATQSAQVSDEVLNALIASMQAAAPTPAAATAVPSEGSGNSAVGSTGANFTQGNLSGAAGMLGTLGNMAGAFGQLTRDADLGRLGGQIGQAASVANAVANPSMASIAPIGLQALGVNAPLGGAVMGGIRGGVPGAISGALSGALTASNPTLAALSALSGMLGGPTANQAVSALVGNMPSMSPMGVPNTGAGLLGALSSAFGVGQLGQEVYNGIGYERSGEFGLSPTSSPGLSYMGGGQGITPGSSGMGLSYSGDFGNFGSSFGDSFGGFGGYDSDAGSTAGASGAGAAGSSSSGEGEASDGFSW